MSTTYRGRTVVTLCGLAVLAGGVAGHTMLPHETAQAAPPVVTQETKPETVPTRDRVYAAYLATFTDGCAADFDQNYFGLIRYDTLPEALRQQIAEDDLAMHGQPVLEDYDQGSVLTLPDTAAYVAYLGSHDGACKR